MTVRLIAIDIDGTLLDSTGRLPDANRRAIHAAVTRGVEVVLAILKPGNSFGELSLIDGLPRSANVAAMAPSVCYFLPRDAFLLVLRENLEIAYAMLPALASMVRSSDQWVASLI